MAKYIEHEKILQELVKAQETVKWKYGLIKSEKENTEHILTKSFEPIIDPIQKLVEFNLYKNKWRKVSNDILSNNCSNQFEKSVIDPKQPDTFTDFLIHSQ